MKSCNIIIYKKEKHSTLLEILPLQKKFTDHNYVFVDKHDKENVYFSKSVRKIKYSYVTQKHIYVKNKKHFKSI